MAFYSSMNRDALTAQLGDNQNSRPPTFTDFVTRMFKEFDSAFGRTEAPDSGSGTTVGSGSPTGRRSRPNNDPYERSGYPVQGNAAPAPEVRQASSAAQAQSFTNGRGAGYAPPVSESYRDQASTQDGWRIDPDFRPYYQRYEADDQARYQRRMDFIEMVMNDFFDEFADLYGVPSRIRRKNQTGVSTPYSFGGMS
jgi:hypothetical protein